MKLVFLFSALCCLIPLGVLAITAVLICYLSKILAQMVWLFGVIITIALGTEVFGALIVIMLIDFFSLNIYVALCIGILSAIFSLLIMLKYRGKDIYAMIFSPF